MNLNLTFHVLGCFVVFLELWFSMTVFCCWVVCNFALNMRFYLNENTRVRVSNCVEEGFICRMDDNNSVCHQFSVISILYAFELLQFF